MTLRRAAVLVAVAAFLVHLRAREGAFLFYDDTRFVAANEHLDRVANPLRYFSDLELTTSSEKPTHDIYRPLRTLAYALLRAGFGNRPGPNHLLALLFHAGAAALLVLLGHRAGLAPWPAAAAGCVFALHPATVEVTGWICSLGDAMCGFFALGAVLAWARDRRAIAFAALAAALFSKEHAVVVPGLWLAWDWFLRRERVRPGALARGVVPGLALVVAFLLVRAHAGAGMSQLPGPLGGSHATAALTMLAGLGWYAGTLLFPYQPTFDARVALQDSPFALPVLLGAAVLALLVYGALRGTPRSRLGCTWFLMALVPVSNVIVPLKIPTADRFLYLPLMGLALLAGELAQRAPRIAVRAAPATLALLAALAYHRLGDWHDDASLIAAGQRVAPRSKMLLWAEAAMINSRAADAFEAGRAPLAEAFAARAAELYRLYIRNALPVEQIQARIEMGDLMYAVGISRQRRGGDFSAAYRDALESYRAAWELQRRGLGRVIEREVVHVADRLADLATRLAVPGERDVARLLGTGMQALDWLERAQGRDVRLARARLRLIHGIVVRYDQPERAGEDFDAVLETLGVLDREGSGAWTAYLRAQAVFYRSILRIPGLDRQGLENSVALYRRAAAERPAFRFRCRAYEARAQIVIAEKCGAVERFAEAKRILEGILRESDQGRRLPPRLRSEVASLLERAGGR